MDEHRSKQRPHIDTIVEMKDMTPEETFQNTTLRPLLKMQNALLTRFVSHYFSQREIVFDQLSEQKQNDLLTSLIQREQAVKNCLLGMIIGQFTLEEYDVYSQSSAKLNKRIYQMLLERLKTNKHLLATSEKQG